MGVDGHYLERGGYHVAMRCERLEIASAENLSRKNPTWHNPRKVKPRKER